MFKKNKTKDCEVNYAKLFDLTILGYMCFHMYTYTHTHSKSRIIILKFNINRGIPLKHV